MYNNEDNDYMNNNSDNNSRNYENVEPDNNQSTAKLDIQHTAITQVIIRTVQVVLV